MSHAKLLQQRINDAIEAGHYRAKGTPRAKEPKAEETKRAAPSPRPEPKERAEAPAKREPLDHGSFVQGLARRRVEAVGESVHQALDAKFRGKK
jgi:hypothetical protein